MSNKEKGVTMVAHGDAKRRELVGINHLSLLDYSKGDGRSQPRYGQIIGSSWLKRAKKSDHMVQCPKPAWAIDLLDLLAALQCGVKTLEIDEVEEQVTYTVSLQTFVVKGQSFNRGHGEQVMLPLGYWRTSRADDAEEPEKQVVQLGLFGGEDE